MKPRANCHSCRRAWAGARALLALNGLAWAGARASLALNGLAWAAFAQFAFAQPATVTGQITETLHGKPVAKVAVTLRGQAWGTPPTADVYSTQTDSEGRFRIRNLAAGRYSMTLSRQGFVTATPPALTLQPSEQHAPLTLQLTPAGVISGRILDADGDPVRDVFVASMQLGDVNGRRELIAFGSAQSNDRGEYRLYNATPGAYYVQATARAEGNGAAIAGEEIRSPRSQESFVVTYYPNGHDTAAGAPLRVSPGEELSGIDIRLLREKVYTLRVKFPNGPAPGSRPLYTLQSRSTGGAGGYRNLNSAAFNDFVEFRAIVPGSYLLTGISRGSGKPESFARQTVEVVDHDMEIDAPAFNAALEVSGSVRVDAPTFRLPRLRLMLQTDYANTYLPDPSTWTADGAFAFHGVAPDSYSLVMTLPAGAYLKSVKLGNRELPDLRLDLSGGAAPLAILLGTDGGHIQGAVQNAAGEPAARTPVTLFPEGRQRDRQDRARTVLTDAAGKYTFQDIAPGDYRLYAWNSGDPDAARDAGFRKSYQGQSVAVSVTPRGSLTVTLKTVSH